MGNTGVAKCPKVCYNNFMVTTEQHKCRWILEMPKDGWCIAKCKWCNRKRAFNNDPVYDTQGREWDVDPAMPNQGERNALRNAGVMVSNKKWTPQEKWVVRESVRKIGITATSKKYNIPKQTLSFWFKGLTPNKYRANMYTNEFKMEVGKYAEDTDNNSGTAKKFNVTRGSVQNWRKQYLTGSRK